MKARARFCVKLLFIALILLMAGCVRQEKEGDLTVYSMEPWVPLSILLGGIIAIPVGVVLIAKRKNVWLGIILVLGGPGAIVFFSLPMFSHGGKVGPDHFEATYGFIWSPSHHNIQFNDLSKIRLVEEKKTGRRGRKSYSYKFECYRKSGGVEKVELGTVMQEAMEQIVKNATAKGVAIEVQEAK